MYSIYTHEHTSSKSAFILQSDLHLFPQVKDSFYVLVLGWERTVSLKSSEGKGSLTLWKYDS